jgi:hypothetical protein
MALRSLKVYTPTKEVLTYLFFKKTKQFLSRKGRRLYKPFIKVLIQEKLTTGAVSNRDS